MAVIEVIQDLQGIIGAIGFLAALVFGSLYGKSRAEKDRTINTIATLEKENQALKDLIETRELQHQENQARIIALEQKGEVLQNLVTQAPSISKLAVQIGRQHNAMMKKFTEMTKELSNVAQAIAGKEQ